MRRDKPKPRFKDVKFDGKTWEECNAKLQDWLSKSTYKKVVFADQGFDLRMMWLTKSGEIINTDFQGSIYIGGFINMEKLEEFVPVELYIEGINDSKWRKINGFIPEKIEIINEEWETCENCNLELPSEQLTPTEDDVQLCPACYAGLIEEMATWTCKNCGEIGYTPEWPSDDLCNQCDQSDV